MSAPIEVLYRRGIYLPEPNLWLDPPFGVERAFISHAHSDHVARHDFTLSSSLTAELMRKRFHYPESADVCPLRMDEVWEENGWQVRLLPAGHIIGSAMLHLTRFADGATLLYTGDFKLRESLSAETCRLLPAQTLIMECTFGLPSFVFPPRRETFAKVLHFLQEALEEGAVPVLFAYSLGKAQEILCALAEADFPVMLHSSVFEMAEACKPHLARLPRYERFSAENVAGHVLVFPPSNGKSGTLKKIKKLRTAMLSGWALTPGARYRYQVDEVFPLSDHADFPELMSTVQQVQPDHIWLVHGYTQEFSSSLRNLGYDACSLAHADQLELRLESGDTLPAVTTATVASSAEMKGTFDLWAKVCEQVSQTASRKQKIQLLSEFLKGIQHDELSLAARFFAADLGLPSLQTGWALIRRALMGVSGLSEREFRAISRLQADSGRTAYLTLQRGQVEPVDTSLTEVADFFRQLQQSRGQMQRIQHLRDRMVKLTPLSASWLVRLMTQELRMGSKDGLIEEVISHASTTPLDVIREALMVCADAGRVAQLAQRGELAQITPQLFTPFQVMLASPEETAEAIWQRLQSPQVWLEDKYDGIRVQAHVGARSAQIYTRDLKPIGPVFPEVVSSLHGFSEELILDGELIAYAEDKKLSFFDLQKRLGRRDQTDLFLPSQITVLLVVFDLLWINGRSLLDLPLGDRRELLQSLPLPAGLRLIEVTQVPDIESIEAAFGAARARGNEGLIAKDPQSPYTPGRRGKAWLKLKKAFATLDVVVVKVEQGHGKRAHLLSDYTFAVKDSRGTLRVIGKAYSGLTNEEIEQLTEHFKKTTIEEKGRARWVEPKVVLEIAFDSIQPSQRHDSGLSLRFPRIRAIRQDKTPDEIDTLAYAQRLAGVPVSEAAS